MSIADELIGRLTGGSMDGLEAAAHQVLEEAKRNVPVGDPAVDPDPNVSLADSGHVEREGNGFIVSFDAAYAAKQHEDLHLKHPRGGGPKYLERALTGVMPSLERIIASRVEARLSGGLLSSATRSHHTSR